MYERPETLQDLIDQVTDAFPNYYVHVSFDRDNHDEIKLTLWTGYVEPADGQQLHTVEEIEELEETLEA